MSVQDGLSVVGLYAGLNGLILFWLAVNVGMKRRSEKVFMGDAQNPVIVRAMRGQANFVEYAPLCLISLGLLAAQGVSGVALQILGAALTLGRLLHAWHFVQRDAPAWQRAGGTALTFAVLLVSSIWLCVKAINLT